MSIFSGLENIVKENASLKDLTWYALGGCAQYLVRPQSVQQLQDVVRRCTDQQMPMRVLGLGSNLLISDEGVKGVVLKLDAEAFTQATFEGTTLKVGAGANISKLVLDSVRRGLGGLEALTGIPGSVGGVIHMNAGGSFGDIGSCTEKITAIDKQGNLFEKAKPELVFDYRWVNVTAPVILDATLQLNQSDPDQMLKTVKEVWIYKKNTQPLNTHNAGCVFKNPRGMSAGALIDRAGLKGTQIGGAVVSEKHANFITTESGCKSADVKQLIGQVQAKVKEKFDVELELEIEIW